METRAHHVAVGAFVLAMVVLAVVAVLWIARSSINTQYDYYDIYFKGPVTGLRNGAPVEYNGVPVGRVSDVKIVPFEAKLIGNKKQAEAMSVGENDEAPATMIRVTVEIDAGVTIKEDVRASVETNILSGVSYILIVKGSRKAPVLKAKAGQRYPVIPAHRSRLASVVARAPQLLDKADQALQSANDLLNKKNREAFAESLDSLRSFSAGLAARNKDIAEFTSNAKKAAATLADLAAHIDKSYSGPDGIGKGLTATISDLDRFAKHLTDTNRQIQAMLNDVRPGVRDFSKQTLPDIAMLVGETRRLVTGLNRLTAEIERDPSRVLFGDRREGYRPR